jgi:hypothetical protein
MSLATAVTKLSRPRQVRRRTALVYDGSSPRPSEAQTEVTAVVVLHMQRQPPTALDRQSDGDESGGAARVWVTTAALSAAYDTADEDDPPNDLGWTELQIAPPEDEDGPPGDLISWEGRRWEVIEFEGWDETFRGPARFLRYKAQDRGASW